MTYEFVCIKQVSGSTAILPKVLMYTFDALLQIGLPCWFSTQLRVQVYTYIHTPALIKRMQVTYKGYEKIPLNYTQLNM